ncbi:hypothetical protein STEG23_019735 [Scotinomys teguina]
MKRRRCRSYRCPSTEEWISKTWYIYTMEYYAAEKNNDIMKFAGKWMELENVILSESTMMDGIPQKNAVYLVVPEERDGDKEDEEEEGEGEEDGEEEEEEEEETKVIKFPSSSQPQQLIIKSKD